MQAKYLQDQQNQLDACNHYDPANVAHWYSHQPPPLSNQVKLLTVYHVARHLDIFIHPYANMRHRPNTLCQ